MFYETKMVENQNRIVTVDHTALAKDDVTSTLLLKNGHFFKGLLKCHCLKEMHYLQDSCSLDKRKQCIYLKSNKHTIKTWSLEKWFMKQR